MALGGGDDEATAQCRIVAALARRLMLPSITLETNGIGKFLPAILRNVLAQEGLAARVQEFSNHRPKEMRILESFDALLAARRLYVHQDVLKTPFLTEMREWRPGRGRGHDDGLDAVAGRYPSIPSGCAKPIPPIRRIAGWALRITAKRTRRKQISTREAVNNNR